MVIEMRFSAHTNATGGYRIEDSINLFAKLGFKGIEIGCNELSGVSTSLRRRERRKVATYAQDCKPSLLRWGEGWIKLG